MSDFDIVVIGAGPGGYPAALRAARLGRRVAIVEREAWGGTCLHWGCIPTKTLIASADLCHRARHAGDLGIETAGVRVDYGRLVERKAAVVTRLAAGVTGLLDANGVERIQGEAHLEGPRDVAVHTREGERRWLRAGRIVVAAGSFADMPGFLPRHPRVVESRAFLERTALPERLLVLGGGVVGCEFACLAARLGARVTVVELLDDILLVADRDVRRAVRRGLQALGIEVHAGAPLEDIVADDGGVRGRCGGKALAADLLLAAVGRRPATERLGLDRAGVACDERGRIRIDAFGRTNVPTILAVGDVTAGSAQLAHAATAQGVAAAETACGRPRPFETLIPSCIFTAPEVGLVGLTEERAQREGRGVVCGTFPFRALGRALAGGETEGFVKWVADAKTNQVLGAQAVGPHATELIAEATVAIRAELTLDEVGRTVHCHPTLSESWMEAAHAVHGECLHLPPPRKAAPAAVSVS
jgi:dihydrolipoamide dehydrogenase